MKIKIINPNTTWSMTKSIEEGAKKYARKDVEVFAVSPETGPATIESYVDEYLAIPGVMAEIKKGEKAGDIDAYIISCFGDPGLLAARELTDKPVIGIAEAAMAVAKTIAPCFSIVCVMERSRGIVEDVVHLHGAEKFFRSLRTTGLTVLEFEKDPEKGMKALAEQSKKAVVEDKAECIVLGCAGFVKFAEDLRKELGVPVLDGVTLAVKFAEAMVDMKLKTSKALIWGYPEKKEILGFSNFGF